jgi:hypothetical protein
MRLLLDGSCTEVWRILKLQMEKTICLYGEKLRLCQPFGAGIIFLILAHPVYKILIIQEPNKLEL